MVEKKVVKETLEIIDVSDHFIFKDVYDIKNIESITKRIKLLREKNIKQKLKVEKLLKVINQKSKTTENEENNKLYLPGEYDAISLNKPRIFNFKPDVSEIFKFKLLENICQ